MVLRNTKWRLEVHAWVILENEGSGDQDEMLIKMCMKFELNWRSGRYLIRTHKKYVQNKWDFVEDQEEGRRLELHSLVENEMQQMSSECVVIYTR